MCVCVCTGLCTRELRTPVLPAAHGSAGDSDMETDIWIPWRQMSRMTTCTKENSYSPNITQGQGCQWMPGSRETGDSIHSSIS